MAKFLSDLVVKELNDTCAILVQPLIFMADDLRIITVPAGFVTDYASVPRFPIIFELFGGIAKKAAVLHDYLYSFETIPRDQVDRMFLSAMRVQGIALWRRLPMYWGVRVFGEKYYTQKDPSGITATH